MRSHRFVRPTSRWVAAVRQLALGLALIGASAGCRAAADPPARHEVTIEAMQYSPASLTVAPGDTIVWTNKDMFPHTVTSKTGGFDSQAIPPDGSWTYVARTTGEFSYVCTFHPTMTGTLEVEEGVGR